jgi:hypothetical protein
VLAAISVTVMRFLLPDGTASVRARFSSRAPRRGHRARGYKPFGFGATLRTSM